MLGFLRSGKKRSERKEVYAYISSNINIAVEEQESMIKLWSSMSKHYIVKWFINDQESLLNAIKERPLPVVVFDESMLDKSFRDKVKKNGIPIISAKPKEGPPTVGC
ncbi:MAG: hypothetical protein GSR85_03315 [Desulfurococcales archaeon]|nr:hypothetical protein [Desulfurococcales archaeon]